MTLQAENTAQLQDAAHASSSSLLAALRPRGPASLRQNHGSFFSLFTVEKLRAMAVPFSGCWGESLPEIGESL